MNLTMNLRDTLLAALAKLPGTREFHLHVLVSSPRKHAALYPFAHPRPRSYLQDILILLSEQATPDAPRILVAAIEASVYNIPVTSCAILYISKVDSTGQSTHPSPTAALVRSLLVFYGDPATRPVAADNLWIHLFARAQGQYLFPNSSEYAGKRPLSDVKLCAWWKLMLSEVAEELHVRTQLKAAIKLYYVLPGYSEFEATHSLKFASASMAASAPYPWTYRHPYSQSEIPLPCPADRDSAGKQNLGRFIPSFEDDPKSRFMDEIAYTTDVEGIKSPERKRPRTKSHSDGSPPTRPAVGEEKEPQYGKDDLPLGELGKVTPDEFWERMSFRQECIAGAVTGFFTLGMSHPSPNDAAQSACSPLAPQPGQVSSQINKRIMTSLLTGVEFSTVERSVRATETIEGALRGLCEGLPSISAATLPGARPQHASDRRTPEPESRTALLAPPRTPPPRMVNGKRAIPDVSPNPFPEPVTSLETYHSYIYGSICVSNPPLPSKLADEGRGDKASGNAETTPQVTVLAVRKKKKRTES